MKSYLFLKCEQTHNSWISAFLTCQDFNKCWLADWEIPLSAYTKAVAVAVVFSDVCRSYLDQSRCAFLK